MKIITPYVPGWPADDSGVTFRFEVGEQLVFVNGKLVGAVKERSDILQSHFNEVPSAICSTLECWRLGDKVKRDAIV
ncbi:hypothetical protein O3W44_22505 [Pantoea sp. LMR881]|uniref:hypothetical protein n=1 Tax=Pantoea sp. LMR881 TaxID=3014336 RepID=UPI0022B06F22|nr:hypothetical protein [Pantoea sp. LMR881]MCZ4061195.1 hypothetical protein [Pantoea sp. LMR881]MCZ4061306.1 hypothetical protein [Pantoea sp. LMR881]